MKTLALLIEGEKLSLQRMGTVLHVSCGGNLILKTENLPRIGDQVVDENLKSVGTVFDVFGPISSPYIAVRPSVEKPNRFVSRVVYFVPSSESRIRLEKRRK